MFSRLGDDSAVDGACGAQCAERISGIGLRVDGGCDGSVVVDKAPGDDKQA
jgi:hypothetical protein